VPTLSTQDLAQACRIFLSIAYPDGLHSIPAAKQPYYEIPADALVVDYLPPSKNAIGLCQDLSKTKAGIPGYEFRLGSMSFPHLKLRIQNMEFHHTEIWVYSVDTHDHFHHASQHLTAEEAEVWQRITEQNRTLKHQIEGALAAGGYLTPKNLLKLDLTSPTSPQI